MNKCPLIKFNREIRVPWTGQTWRLDTFGTTFEDLITDLVVEPLDSNGEPTDRHGIDEVKDLRTKALFIGLIQEHLFKIFYQETE